MSKTIAQQLEVTQFPFVIKDNYGKKIYLERSDGVWIRWVYDDVGNLHYFETSLGHKSKHEYNDGTYELFDGLSDADWKKENIEKYYQP